MFEPYELIIATSAALVAPSGTVAALVGLVRHRRPVAAPIDFGPDHNLSVQPPGHAERGEEILALREELARAGVTMQGLYERIAALEVIAADRDRLERLRASRWRTVKRLRAQVRLLTGADDPMRQRRGEYDDDYVKRMGSEFPGQPTPGFVETGEPTRDAGGFVPRERPTPTLADDQTACTCDSGALHSEAENRARHPFIVSSDCSIHGSQSIRSETTGSEL